MGAGGVLQERPRLWATWWWEGSMSWPNLPSAACPCPQPAHGNSDINVLGKYLVFLPQLLGVLLFHLKHSPPLGGIFGVIKLKNKWEAVICPRSTLQSWHCLGGQSQQDEVWNRIFAYAASLSLSCHPTVEPTWEAVHPPVGWMLLAAHALPEAASALWRGSPKPRSARLRTWVPTSKPRMCFRRSSCYCVDLRVSFLYWWCTNPHF